MKYIVKTIDNISFEISTTETKQDVNGNNVDMPVFIGNYNKEMLQKKIDECQEILSAINAFERK